MSVTASFEINPDEPSECPPGTIKRRGLSHHKKNGIAVLAVTGGGAGQIVLQGSKRVRRFSRSIDSSGKGRLKIRAKGNTARKLRKRGGVKLKVRFTYQPGGNCPAKTRSTRVKLVRKR